MGLSITPIGYIRTPFKQKFSIPRQGGLVPDAKGQIIFTAEFTDPRFFEGLDAHSHLWLIFEFHQHREREKSAMVRPPRLGGNTSMGVFATRSSFRPNNLGLSVVTLDTVECTDDGTVLHVSGMDLLDNTPIIDIKPYIPYADSIVSAHSHFAPGPPSNVKNVIFSAQTELQLEAIEQTIPEFEKVLCGVLEQDPRPAYKKNKVDTKHYAVSLYEFDITWYVENDEIIVLTISPLN